MFRRGEPAPLWPDAGLTCPTLANTASASSTRTIPYICLLAATRDDTASSSRTPTDGTARADKLPGSAVQVTVSALVPRNRGQPDGPLKLWTLRAHVPQDQENRSLDVNDVAGPAHAPTGLDHAAKAERWCRMAEENAYAGSKRSPKLHCVVNPAGGKGKAKAVWTEEVRPMFEAAGCQFDVSCEFSLSGGVFGPGFD